MIKVNYEAQVKCYNCGFEGNLLIEKGVEVKDVDCPGCDNVTLYPKPENE